MSYEGKKVVRDGVTLNVLDKGEGLPVLLIHGFPDSNYLWRHQIQALTKAGYRVIAPDLRGFGLSDRPEGVEQYLIPETIADIAAILDEVGVKEKAALVGHDWGAVICWGVIDRMPERFSCFFPMSVGPAQTYVNCTDIRQKEMSWYILYFQMQGLPEQTLTANDWRLFREWVRHHHEVDHWLEDLSREGALTSGLNWYRANMQWLMEAGEEVSRVPTMGLWSDGDAYLVEELVMAAGRYVQADWHYERVENASHWMMLDRPDHVNRLLLNFLKQYHPAT